MKKIYLLLFTILITSASFGQTVINEFQPNANGTDPDPASVELKGTPTAAFSGWILSIESDPGSSTGVVDRATSVSGNFDANGLLVVSIPDLENPSFTIVLVDVFTGSIGDDLDTNDDGSIDDTSKWTTVYDAIGIPDDSSPTTLLYGADLGGSDFAYTGDEPQLVFRDGATGDLYAVNDPDNGEVYDINATEVIALGSFDIPANATTFGSINPIYTLATGPVIIVSSAITGLDYEVGTGGPSAEGITTISGTNLTAGITVLAPTNFEVSLASGSGFGLFVIVSQSGGIANATVYVRLKSGLSVNPYSGLINATSTDADDKTIAVSGNVYDPPTNSLIISGVFDAQDGSSPKGVELYVKNDIADLSLYGVGSANNGGGTDGQEFTFPAVPATQGQYIYVIATGHTAKFTTFFGFAPDYESGAMSINGDDAIELFESTVVIDVHGDINVDGTGEAWDSVDGWAYRVNDTGPDGSTFILANWTFSGTGQLDGATNAASTVPFPIGTYSNSLSVARNDIEGFSVYPNPVNAGEFTIRSMSNLERNVQIYDMLGKQVYNKQVRANERVQVSNLTQGFYILKVEEEGKTATRKLIIE